MPSPHLPRFKRAPTTSPIHLTERDLQIIRLVHRHRFLRSAHIVKLVGGSPQQLLRRLQLLYHYGFLERPRAQLDYYQEGGSRHIVYGLGNKGGTHLRKELGDSFRKVCWGEKNRGVSRIFLEHALLISDVMVAIELSCQKREVRLIHGEDIDLPVKRRPFQWKVSMRRGVKLGVVPDRVFGLEFSDAQGNHDRRYFLLEADRGTMPVKRRHLSQTSFQRKLLAYTATWEQDLHRSLFGFHRFRVLTVTKSAARVKSLVDACSQLVRGHGLFLFADRSILSGDILTSPWQTGRPGETGFLLE